MTLFEITDADIEAAEKRLGFQFDDPRKNFLKCIDSLDVQSCAGSGKTTLLVTKLDILARKWLSRTQGICVLSHTNVAKDEIEKRLGGSVSGMKLLSHPHFIGTIQEFVDRFLALPYLRSEGKKVVYLDSQLFKIAARNYYLSKCRSDFSDTPPWWKKSKDNRQRDTLLDSLTFIFEDGELKINLSSLSEDLQDQHSDIANILEQIKTDLSDFGVYQYEDMFPIACQHLHISKNLDKIIQYRFPLVLIDEVQDTQSHQLELLEQIFPHQDCKVQRLGDANQAIYSSAGNKDGISFPRDPLNALDLNTTHRFDQWIADQASTTTVIKQDIQSQSDNHCYPHTIFLCDERTRCQVLPAFADLISKCKWVNGCNAHTVGAIATKESKLNIGDYWNRFDRSIRSKTANPSTLIGFARLSQTLCATDNHLHKAIPKLRDGVVRLAKDMGIEPEDDSNLTWNRLYILYQGKEDELKKLNLWIYKIVNHSGLHDETEWQNLVATLKRILAFVGGDCSKADDFCSWQESLQVQAISANSAKINIFEHNDIEIHVGTIHSVKGETHDATLILETKWYDYDIKKALEWVSGGQPNPPTQTRQKERFKRLHVGMTRPRHLLCMALDGSHMTGDICSLLVNKGWQIKDLRQQQP